MAVEAVEFEVFLVVGSGDVSKDILLVVEGHLVEEGDEVFDGGLFGEVELEVVACFEVDFPEGDELGQLGDGPVLPVLWVGVLEEEDLEVLLVAGHGAEGAAHEHLEAVLGVVEPQDGQVALLVAVELELRQHVLQVHLLEALFGVQESLLHGLDHRAYVV